MNERDASRADLRDAEGLVAEIRQVYASSTEGWASGPARLYGRLARALVSTAPAPLRGGRVLDLGTGTGVASEILHEVGAEPVGLDLVVEMLAHRQAHRPPGVAGDAQMLPFRDGSFDAVVAAFSLNHVPDLGRALAECRRVLRRGGVLLASTFPSGEDHPAKAIVEEVLERYGYLRPSWYRTFKDHVAHLTGDPDTFVTTAAAAGFRGVRIERIVVDAGLDQPELAAEWRLNMPHTLTFLAGLEPARRAALRRDAVAALQNGSPPEVTMVALSATGA
jgi:ubiquinone/menaquinone biosynthesis C-methylase UbiE